MIITNQDNNFVVYAHKTNRHNWNMYGHWLTLEEGLLDLDRLTKDYSRYWPMGEFALVKITFAENDNHEIPDNLKRLPGTMLRTRLALDTQGG